jgi:hypothetical protein
MRTIWLAVVAVVACIAASEGAAGNFDRFRMGCVGEEPAVCPTATVGQAYSLPIYLDRDSPTDFDRGGDFDCATYHVSSGGFPPGLTISDEGFLIGTPTEPGHYDFYLTVEYNRTLLCPGKPASDDRFVINVDPAPPKVTITTASLPDAKVDEAYTSPPLVAAGAPVNSWSLVGGMLPAGLTLAPNGVISGTPTESGLFGFTVQANATAASDDHQLSLFVLAPLAIQTLVDATPPDTGLTAKRVIGQPLVTGVKAVGGRAPYTFGADGGLPPGLTLDPASGIIAGAGTRVGEYPFTVTVTDAMGVTASVHWRVTILPLLAVAPTAERPPPGHVGTRYHWMFRTVGASKSRVFVLSGRPPPGLVLDRATGRLTGTPRKRGNYRITIRVRGDAGSVLSRSFTIRIR